MELEGREIFYSSLHPWFLQRPPLDFRPTDLTSTYFVCTRMVFGGIEHLTQALRYGVRCSNPRSATRLPPARLSRFCLLYKYTHNVLNEDGMFRIARND
ncbi:hypothetical protein TNCV_808431 [Trichonephila clavipes]|nr:hypothetical protein TNCV_808431 [Trichonephila clavipes]